MSESGLRDLSARIERLVTDPDSVRAPWARLARPILSRIGWQPRVEVRAVQALLSALRVVDRAKGEGLDRDALAQLFSAARAELERNVVTVERACVVNGKPSVAHAAWLRRLHDVVRRASVAVDRLDDLGAVRVAAYIDPVIILPPLAVRASTVEHHEADAQGGVAGPDANRLLELQLASVDHLLEAARNEPEVLERRRRLLEAARQVLLETTAALPVDDTGTEPRRAFIAREIARLDRLQALGIAPEIGLLHQARSALAQGDRAKLHAALVAMDGAALARGDAATAARTGAAIAKLWNGADPNSEAARAYSLARSAEELLGADVVCAVKEAYIDGRERLASPRGGRTYGEQEQAHAAMAYLATSNIAQTFAAATSVDGCFELGGAVAPVRVVEYETRVAAVRFPTADLVLLQAQEINDIPDALIEDPRSLLLQMAAGRLLARRYVREERTAHVRTRMQGEVRVYVLDGSGSMLGPRARMRDALMVAELATLMRRKRHGGRSARVVLFYRYFNSEVGPTTRVDDEHGAFAAIDDIVGNVRVGGTDIEVALRASFAQVIEARAQDPDLGRAQVVLVTDGEAPVNPEVVTRAREQTGDLPVGLSVIALGQENAALRDLVARERERGERAFYHFIPDTALADIVEGRDDTGPALHLPPSGPPLPAKEEARELNAAVGGLLEELATLGKARDVDALEALEFEDSARAEMGLSVGEGMSEGERARAEALHKDRRALELRFARWFPLLSTPPGVRADPPARGTPERDDLEAAVLAISTVAEVVQVTSGTALARRADAIEVLERLLPDARLSPGRYEAVLRAYPGAVGPAVSAVHTAVGKA